MNFNEAIAEMSKGNKVQLSDWLGYWFKDNEGNIKVFTRDGDILDTPNIERYKDRDDWEVTNGNMSFDFAIRALKNGKRVTRSGWNGKGMFLFMLPAGTVPTKAIHDPALRQVIEEKVGGDTFEALGSIRMFTADKKILTGWLASQTDMLCNDWELVN